MYESHEIDPSLSRSNKTETTSDDKSNPSVVPAKRRISTKQLAAMAMLTALGIILSAFIDIPLIPAAPYLKYDPSGIPMLLGSLLYGPIAGSIIAIATCLIHGSADGPIGILMNILGSLAMVVPAGIVFLKLKKQKGGLVIALVVGALCMVLGNIIFNLILTPIYLGVSTKVVAQMIVPILLPFNILKALINAILAYLLYKAVSRFLETSS